jgi:hypothetical protein
MSQTKSLYLRRGENMNKLIVIGYIGYKKCYLNISLIEAKNKFAQENSMMLEDVDLQPIKEIEFNNTFEVYDVWV